MDNKDLRFWLTQDDAKLFNNYFIDCQIKEWQLIVDEWGNSSVQLKNYLNKYFPNDDKNFAVKLADINVNYILPCKKGSFWGTRDLDRLKLAMKAKLIILSSSFGVDDDSRTLYAVECLRLWLRFDSRHTKLTWKGFYKMVDEAYIETEQDYFGTITEVQDACKRLKPKRKQTAYHYKAEDFQDIREWMKLQEAYDFWNTYTFPHLLENYKRAKVKELSLRKFNVVSNEEFTKLNNDLNLIKIKPLTIKEFARYLKKFKIKYKTRN